MHNHYRIEFELKLHLYKHVFRLGKAAVGEGEDKRKGDRD
jgi:hypothetical protein